MKNKFKRELEYRPTSKTKKPPELRYSCFSERRWEQLPAEQQVKFHGLHDMRNWEFLNLNSQKFSPTKPFTCGRHRQFCLRYFYTRECAVIETVIDFWFC